ncbi:MAG TPA: alpha/beta fold hydrolase [Reyranella sp.]|nr:alpha/beta fold hydrolase [Reyranella sp.]
MIRLSVATVALAFAATSAYAADYPAPKPADFVVKNFRFHTGETMPELKVHYVTVGEPTGQPVLILHGTAGSSSSMVSANFAGELFGPGQPLDATKYFIIMPDGIGHGRSSKPSDGLRTKFPRYDYADMVDAQYRLVTEGLGIKHLRLVMGNSMGGMHTWLWGEKYPDFVDALAPMAAQPTAMSSRNWMMRRLIIDSIRNDPDWKGGNYTEQPKAFRSAAVFYGIASAGGTLAYAKQAPTREAADKLLDERLAHPTPADANDYLYAWESSGDYDAAPGLGRITARVLAIDSADDERNPPETGLMENALKQVKNGKLYLIPASEETRGHLTTGNAKFYARQLGELLQETPTR